MERPGSCAGAARDANLVEDIADVSGDGFLADEQLLGDGATEPATVAALAKQGVSAFAMEFIPRITRAQVMDALSSQANLAGYRAGFKSGNSV